MTDKKEIIIDGVDVGKCEHLTEIQGCWLTTCDYLKYKGNITNKLCKYNHNCYYKQLARKEQECDKYKEALDEVRRYRVCEINDEDGEEGDVILGIIDETKEQNNGQTNVL